MGEKFDSISALYGSTEGGLVAGELHFVSDFREHIAIIETSFIKLVAALNVILMHYSA